MKIVYDPSKNRNLNDFGLDEIRFQRGLNDFTNEQFGLLKSHPDYESLLNSQALILTEVDPLPTPETKPKSKESVINLTPEK